MPRIIVLILLLMIALATAAPTTIISSTSTENTTEEFDGDVSSMAPVESGTFTIEVDNDVILTTDPDGLAFTEFTESDINSTEEPLPESVLQQLERDRDEQKPNDNSTTNTVPNKTVRNYVTIQRNSSKPLLTTTENSFGNTTTDAPVGKTTTENIDPHTEKSIRNYFGKLSQAKDLKNIKSEEKEGGTEPPLFENLSAILNENELDGGQHLSESDGQLVDSQQIFQNAFRTTVASVEVAETTTEAETPPPTTVKVNELSTTEANLSELGTTTVDKQDADITTNIPEVSTVIPSTISASEIGITTTKSQKLFNNLAESLIPIGNAEDRSIILTTNNPENFRYTTFVPETVESTTNYPESFSYTSLAPKNIFNSGNSGTTTLAPDTTPSPSTTNYPASFSYTSLPPETTISTTNYPASFIYSSLEPETTSRPTTTNTLAPETTESTSTTTLPPETTPSTTTTTTEPYISTNKQQVLYNESSTTIATTTTTSTTAAPTTTTTTPRPIQTRAPRIERIFNSDGVEVLYGYSSVVRTNRLN